MSEIKKAIIPMAGLGTRFLPLSKAVPKELFPLVDKPLLQYTIEEAKTSGVEELIFVVSPSNRKSIGDYLKRIPTLEKILEQRKQDDRLEELRKVEKLLEGISFSFIVDASFLGDGHAVLQAKKFVGEEPCFVLFPDDVIDSRIPCSLQLAHVFKTSQKPVMALSRLPKEKLSSYGVVSCEKIANRLYKIRQIVEKPSFQAISSDLAPYTSSQESAGLAIVGRRIITAEVFEYLKKANPNKKGEIVLSEVLGEMVRDGKIVYGYEFEGKWQECGDKVRWLKSQLYFTLRHPEFGKEMRKFVKEEKLI